MVDVLSSKPNPQETQSCSWFSFPHTLASPFPHGIGKLLLFLCSSASSRSPTPCPLSSCGEMGTTGLHPNSFTLGGSGFPPRPFFPAGKEESKAGVGFEV